MQFNKTVITRFNMSSLIICGFNFLLGFYSNDLIIELIIRFLAFFLFSRLCVSVCNNYGFFYIIFGTAKTLNRYVRF